MVKANWDKAPQLHETGLCKGGCGGIHRACCDSVIGGPHQTACPWLELVSRVRRTRPKSALGD